MTKRKYVGGLLHVIRSDTETCRKAELTYHGYTRIFCRSDFYVDHGIKDDTELYGIWEETALGAPE